MFDERVGRLSGASIDGSAWAQNDNTSSTHHCKPLPDPVNRVTFLSLIQPPVSMFYSPPQAASAKILGKAGTAVKQVLIN